jgi:DsbC/DsbD-like thiol-disulfide interchange protein
MLNPVPQEALGPNKDDPSVQRDVQKYVSVVRVNPAMIGMAFPGTFMLDKQGRVTSRHLEDFYVERNTLSSVMMRIGAGTRVAGTRISSDHVDMTTYPSDSSVAPGNRITLAVDVAPRRGVHVYAPGASGYRVVRLALDSQPFVRQIPMKYPASEVYFFKPLKERVPVYQKPFTLLQEIVIEGSPAAQAALRGRDSVTISGAFEYQACDDTVCFNPVSVPLSWMLSLRPLVTPQRAARP